MQTSAFARIAAALDSTSAPGPTQPATASNTAMNEIADGVAGALHDYIVTVGPVQIELSWRRRTEEDGPLHSAMTHLGAAFAHFHGGDDAHGLAELHAARNQLARLAYQRCGRHRLRAVSGRSNVSDGSTPGPRT